MQTQAEMGRGFHGGSRWLGEFGLAEHMRAGGEGGRQRWDNQALVAVHGPYLSRSKICQLAAPSQVRTREIMALLCDSEHLCVSLPSLQDDKFVEKRGDLRFLYTIPSTLCSCGT